MWLPCLHVRAKGKTQGGLAEGKVILQFAFKAVVRIMCVYTCKCAYMCVHRIHVCTHVYVWGCVTACVCVCVHVCACVLHIHVYMCIHEYLCACVYAWVCMCVHVYLCEHVYVCVCTCVSVCLRKSHRLYSGHQESLDRMMRTIKPGVGLFPAPECSLPKRRLIAREPQVLT